MRVIKEIGSMNDSLKDQLIRSVFRMRKVNLIMRYKDMDLATFSLMRALDRNQPGSDENIYLSELCERLCLTKAALSQIANHMEEKGYLTREINKSNRRKVTVTLTPEGHEAMKRTGVEIDQIFSEFMSRLGDEETEELVRLLNRFANIAEELAKEHGA